MAKTAKRHRCIDCGSTTARWAGRCPACGEWNTLVAEAELGQLAQAVDALDLGSLPLALASVDPAEARVVPTGVVEFDRVLSGGLVPGSVTLLGGEPGIGKSTLLLQVLAARAAQGHQVLLVSAEESVHQVRLRAERLGPVPAGLMILPATDVATAAAAVAATGPDLVVIDSIQAMANGTGPDVEGRAAASGSIAQVRQCAAQLVGVAKTRNVATVLVGHVTKDGALAGPRALEHMVDTVLSFEGDRHHAVRLLSAVKHRFGPTGELGLFEMGDHGLNRVADPGLLLLGDRPIGAPGCVVLPSLQGRRTLLVELQVLVTRASQAPARRSVLGLDSGRLLMTLAVLVRHARLSLRSNDVFASVAGGIRVTEPAADLAVALAVASATTGVALPAGLAVVGEIGLSGEVRQVTNMTRRIEESARLGFDRMIVPASSPEGPSGVKLTRVATVVQAVAMVGCSTGPDARRPTTPR